MNFQITLLNYKLDFQNKNMVYFFKLKKKTSLYALQLIFKLLYLFIN